MSVNNAAGKNLERCMRDYGGKRTEPGYISSTCESTMMIHIYTWIEVGDKKKRARYIYGVI